MTDFRTRKIIRGKQYVEGFLSHYSSPYYDPVKAHAYYEEHKILSDKAAKSALTSAKQRTIYAVEKENIAKAKQAEVTTAQNKRQSDVTSLDSAAQASVDSINKSLDALIAQIKTTTAPKLNKIPVNATPQVRAFLEKQNKAIEARAANNTNQKLSEAVGNSQASSRKIVSDLTDAIQAARNTYSRSIAALNTKYSNILDTEKKNIHNKVPGKVPKMVKPKKRS